MSTCQDFSFTVLYWGKFQIKNINSVARFVHISFDHSSFYNYKVYNYRSLKRFKIISRRGIEAWFGE